MIAAKYYAPVFGCVLFSSGCMLVLPYAQVVSEEVTGTIVDSMTGLPVAHARVAKLYLPQTATYTNSEGKFRIRQITTLHVRVIDPANEHIYPQPSGSSEFLHISHEGYKDQQFNAFESGNGRFLNKRREVGTVRLVPK